MEQFIKRQQQKALRSSKTNTASEQTTAAPKPHIYIAGPYSSDPVEGTRNACFAGCRIMDAGGIPFIPHLTHSWHFLCPRGYDTWIAYGKAWVERCDAVYRLRGTSPGASRETIHAIGLGIPVFYDRRGLREGKDFEGLKRWIRLWRPKKPDSSSPVKMVGVRGDISWSASPAVQDVIAHHCYHCDKGWYLWHSPKFGWLHTPPDDDDSGVGTVSCDARRILDLLHKVSII